MAASRSATACIKVEMSSVSLAMEASSSSISACKTSTASVFSFLVCSLVASSVSHQPLCSASSLASSIKRTRRSLIIFFTLRKGSSSTRDARAESTRLSSSPARSRRYWAARTRERLSSVDSERSAANEVPRCARAGRCFSALPDNASLLMISMAFPIAASSSARNCCLASKSEAFFEHVAKRSERYFSSAAFVAEVSSRLPWALALASSFLALV
mmetsp:Transcript_96739/g.224261  ORF Transcript_96739/g.224261 Transcript_96739/m.224261 type:complete len:215 (+) Transcript_96739:515-1159(+)